MMSKEECQKVLDYLFDNSLIDDYSNNIDNKMYDILQRMIDEHFELLDGIQTIINKAKELSDSNDELRGQLYFCEPYKFEDLKPNMWVWDDLIKECVQLDEDCFEPNNVILILMRGNYGYRESTRTFFEENRFFPVQYANLES